MQPDLTIKPVFAPFVLKPTAQLALVVLLCTGAAIEFVLGHEIPIPALALIGLAFLTIGTFFATRFVHFKKTSYSFYPDRIILKTGGLFDERTVDLQLKNITHVSTTIPFLENNFFKTGNVYIQAAGASGTEISMYSIASPMSFYKEIAARMQKNGFSLARKREIQHEQPGPFGTVIQMGEGLSTAIFGFGYLALVVIGQLTSDGGKPDMGPDASSTLFTPILVLTVGILFLGTIVYLALYAIDLSRRNYVLYDDVIDYSDGFLTQRHKFIPLENLADVTLTQTLFRRLFNYSDLVVSCQGANTNINFKVMPRADQFKANLERLIREHKSLQQQQSSIPLSDPTQRDGEINDWNHTQSTSQIAAPQRSRATTNTQNRPALTMRLSLRRAIGGTALVYGTFAVGITLLAVLTRPVLTIMLPGEAEALSAIPLLPLSIGFILVMAGLAIRDIIGHAIAYHATQYRLDDHKIGLHHNMFNKKQVEFTLEKVTAVTIRQGILDRFFATTTLQFHSIGTSEVIVFKHLDDGATIANDILQRLGFEDTQPTRAFIPDFNVKNLLRAQIGIPLAIAGWIITSIAVSIFYPLFLLQLLLVFGLLLAQYAITETFYQRARLELFENHLRLRQGILTISSHYANFHDIKHVHSTQYLYASTGALRWTIAGGKTLQLGYIQEVSAIHDQLDALLYTHPIKAVRQPQQFTTTLLTATKPSLANTLTIILLTCTILFPLLVFLPFILPILIIRFRTKQYIAESSRLVSSWGRMYRNRQTILYNRIDHLTTSSGLLNKIFKNGNIGIATVGSTDMDLTLADFPNHQEFYDTIKQNLPADA